MKVDPEREIVKLICSELKSIRQAKKISQQRLAEYAGLSRTGLRHIESLQTNPTLSSLLKIAKALKVDLAKLLNRQ